ncbi:MAG: hypothetical protein ACOYN0_18925 [Phycisphaerales bacterium]
MLTRNALSVTGFLALAASSAFGQSIQLSYSTPTLDRWMYPFNSAAGSESNASVFAALQQVGFDDRDAQFLLGWSTGSQVQTGRPVRGYKVRSAVVKVYISSGDRWVYDNTYDGVRSSYATTDPDYVPDSDLGVSVELWPVGYRGGFSLTNFNENSAYANVAPFPPTEGVRNAFSALVDVTGAATDLSRQSEFRFDGTPYAVGQVTGLTPGVVAPAGAEMVFTVDVSSIATQAYFGRALRAGRLQLMVSTLAPASGGPGGGTGDPTYPAFFTKENALATALGAEPKLDLVVDLVDPGDYNADGGVDGDDIIAFFADWDASAASADFNLDGGVDGDDVIEFFAEWDNG